MIFLRCLTVTTLLIPTVTPFGMIEYVSQTKMALFSASQQQSETDAPEPSKQKQMRHALDLIIEAKAKTYFPNIPSDVVTASKKQSLIDEPEEERFLTFTLDEHKPLGCTAEESIAISEDGAKHVFIAKITEGGNADKVGLQVGDVIVGVSGSFDEVVEVVGAGIDRVRSLVAGRQTSMNLILKVIRNTNVQIEHEKALVDLCILPEGEGPEANISQCIEALYKSDYEIDDPGDSTNCEDSDAECMLDTLMGSWEEELNVMTGNGKGEVMAENEKDESGKEKKPAPWSSRSSGSGTYVRDPRTGKMVNLDS